MDGTTRHSKATETIQMIEQSNKQWTQQSNEQNNGWNNSKFESNGNNSNDRTIKQTIQWTQQSNKQWTEQLDIRKQRTQLISLPACY
jgi:hypothetical protein